MKLMSLSCATLSEFLWFSNSQDATQENASRSLCVVNNTSSDSEKQTMYFVNGCNSASAAEQPHGLLLVMTSTK